MLIVVKSASECPLSPSNAKCFCVCSAKSLVSADFCSHLSCPLIHYTHIYTYAFSSILLTSLLSGLSLVCPIKNSKWSHKDLSKITYSINIAYSLVACVLSIFLFVIVPVPFLDLANIAFYFNL